MGKLFRKIHIDLSLFFLPLALLYVVSGMLYLFDVSKDYGADVWEYSIPLVKQEELPNAINQSLQERGLKSITNLSIKKAKGGGFEIGGVAYSAVAKQAGNEFKVRVVHRSFWGNLMMLHKGKGKWYFDILAFAFMSSMIIFYFSGLMMTKFCNNRRGRALLVVGLGFLISFIIGYVSVI